MFACTTFADSHAVPSLRRSVDWGKIAEINRVQSKIQDRNEPCKSTSDSYAPAVEVIIARTSADQTRDAAAFLTWGEG